MVKLRASTKTYGGKQRKAKAGLFRKYCTGGKLAGNGKKFNLLHNTRAIEVSHAGCKAEF